MAETLYSARPELSDPAGFLRRAASDLGRAFPIGWHLFGAELRARRRRFLLGWLWLLAPAIATVLVCVYLQSRRIVAFGPTELPYAVHVAAGMVLWQTFVDALNAPLRQLQAARQLLTRSRAPHEAVMVAGLLDVALNALVRLAVLAGLLAVLGIAPASSVMLLPLGAAALALLGLVFGLLAAPWGLLFDDMRQGLMLLAGLWFFLTPIVYAAPEAGLLRLNPVTPLLETSREWIHGGAADPAFLPVAAATLVALVLAWLLYRLGRPHMIARMG